MYKKLTGWVACSVCVAAATPALAQDAASTKSSVSLSTDTGAQTSTSTDTGAQANASTDSRAQTSTSTDASAFQPYEPGYPPDNNLLELGVFGGVLFPSKSHNLRNERHPQHPYQNGPELGARLGWYPL